MTDVLHTGLAWLERMRQQHRTILVAYERGANRSSLPVTIGRTLFRLSDPMVGLIRVESRDYLCARVDFPGAEPQRGDRIYEGDAIYEVLAPGNEPAWRWSDPQRTCIRIHSKRVGSLDPAAPLPPPTSP